jgi:hypothetical protein
MGWAVARPPPIFKFFSGKNRHGRGPRCTPRSRPGVSGPQVSTVHGRIDNKQRENKCQIENENVVDGALTVNGGTLSATGSNNAFGPGTYRLINFTAGMLGGTDQITVGQIPLPDGDTGVIQTWGGHLTTEARTRRSGRLSLDVTRAHLGAGVFRREATHAGNACPSASTDVGNSRRKNAV